MTYHNHKKYICPYCKKDFAKKRQIKAHMKDVHSKMDTKNDSTLKK